MPRLLWPVLDSLRNLLCMSYYSFRKTHRADNIITALHHNTRDMTTRVNNQRMPW